MSISASFKRTQLRLCSVHRYGPAIQGVEQPLEFFRALILLRFHRRKKAHGFSSIRSANTKGGDDILLIADGGLAVLQLPIEIP
jgi:hypothetical protein